MSELDMREVRVTVYRPYGDGVAMRMSHEPTGDSVFGSGQSEHRLREELKARLVEMISKPVAADYYGRARDAYLKPRLEL